MNAKTRVIAFDIHPTRIGYAVVFLGRPLDWGVTRLRRPAYNFPRHLRRLTEELWRLWQPAVAVIRTSPRNRGRHIKAIRRALASRGIHVRMVPDRLVFRDTERSTKHELACDLARRFPELKHLLPRKRRLWDPEDDRMHIFTAVGMAVGQLS